jgi:alpha-beta hydrolase superfamily lysophospholipase
METAAFSPSASGFFPARDGLQLYHEVFRPPASSGGGRARLVIVHGYAEHSGRYLETVRYLAGQGYEVLVFDYRGHGQAGGRRGHIDRFDEYLADLDCALDVAGFRDGAVPLFLLGHSQGGLIAIRFVQRHDKGLRGLVLASPFLGLRMKVPRPKVLLGRAASRVWPRLTLPSGIDPAALSHDASVVEAYRRDRLVHRVATARWFTEATQAQADALAWASNVKLPVLLLHGADDAVADPLATEELAGRLGHTDRTLKLYPGAFHELFNDLGREQVLADLNSWILGHL